MLEGRIILITGSTGGIGFAIARTCLEQGASIIVHGRDEERTRRAANALGPDTGFVVADLMKPEAPKRIIEEVTRKFGHIDGLVNNAARLDRSDIDSFSAEMFDAMMAVNVRGPLGLIQAALPFMKKRKNGGSIVNIGSTNAWCGAPNLLLYSMTKGALMTATRNLGDALSADKVRVNQLNVGWTLTESEVEIQRAEGHPDDWLEHIPKAFSPSGTILRPEQIARHAAFWLSDDSAPITGQVIDVEQYPVIGRNKVSER
jgi:NAD(P)-dependent dehydrogenase (short-subunit alcohol dehydrogenase family)